MALPILDLRQLDYRDARRDASYRGGLPQTASGTVRTLHMVSTHWYFDGNDPRMADELERCLQGLTAEGRKETRRYQDGSRDWLPVCIVVDRYGATLVAVHRSCATHVTLDEVAPPYAPLVAA